MLKGASPNEIDEEEENICSMEETCKEMGSLVEKKILETERRKDDLNDLNDKFLQALQMYQQLMKEPMTQPAPPPQQPPMGYICLLYTSPSPRDGLLSRMPSSA